VGGAKRNPPGLFGAEARHGIAAAKSEYRNPKSETIPNDPNPKFQNRMSHTSSFVGGITSAGFEYLVFEFVSDFGFRNLRKRNKKLSVGIT
jgi:hypothetical protein